MCGMYTYERLHAGTRCTVRLPPIIALQLSLFTPIIRHTYRQTGVSVSLTWLKLPDGRTSMTASPASNATRPTTEDLLQRAAALVPTLRERASQIEKAGQVSPENVQMLVDAGLLRVCTPVRFGGYGHEYNVSHQIAMELARGCGSTAWCYSVWSAHNWMFGFWPLQAQEEYFA